MGKKDKKDKKDKAGKDVEKVETTDGDVHVISPIAELLRLPQGAVDLASYPTDSTEGFPGDDEDDQPDIMDDLEPVLFEMQEKLFANGREDPNGRRVLLILQGLDTAGKGGTIKNVIGMVDPQGVHIKGFKAPTKEELAHDFLWRIEKEIPAPGMIGVFDRSQYEDVLVVRVENLVPEEVWSARYEQINEWEARISKELNCTIVKCYLHVGKDTQQERLAARLEDPTKYWKYNPGDLDTRAKWDSYIEAYEALLTKTNTDVAPWYLIPADNKWYRNWAVAEILTKTLADLDLEFPPADFDIELEKKRVAEA